MSNISPQATVRTGPQGQDVPAQSTVSSTSQSSVSTPRAQSTVSSTPTPQAPTTTGSSASSSSEDLRNLRHLLSPFERSLYEELSSVEPADQATTVRGRVVMQNPAVLAVLDRFWKYCLDHSIDPNLLFSCFERDSEGRFTSLLVEPTQTQEVSFPQTSFQASPSMSSQPLDVNDLLSSFTGSVVQTDPSSSSSSSSSPSLTPKVTPLGKESTREDYLTFMREFERFCAIVNPPLATQNNVLCGPPIHDLDLARTFLLGVNPLGLRNLVAPSLIDSWRLSGFIPQRWTELDLWVNIVLTSQFASVEEALVQLESVRMNWNLSDPEHRWVDYVGRFQVIVYRSTLAGFRKFSQAQSRSVAVNEGLCKQSLAANLGVLRLYLDMAQDSHLPQFARLSDFIQHLSEIYFQWCNLYPPDQQRRIRLLDPELRDDSDVWKTLPTRFAREVAAAQSLKHSSRPSSTPKIPVASSSTPDRSKPVPTPLYPDYSSTLSSLSTPKKSSRCPYCHKAHDISECPEPGCRRSKYYKPDEDDKRKRRDGSKRGAPPSKFVKRNKGGKYSVFSLVQNYNTPNTITNPLSRFKTITAATSPTEPTPSSGTVARFVAHSTVPLRKGSRMIKLGNDKDLLTVKGIVDDSSSIAALFNDSTDYIDASSHPYSGYYSPFENLNSSFSSFSNKKSIGCSIFSKKNCESIYKIHTVGQPLRPNSFIELNILINDVPIKGIIDTAASCSVITKDLATQSSMTLLQDSIEYLSANNVTTSSLGSAQGVLSFRLGNVANLVRVTHRLPIIPGVNKLLIGTDILTSLGLLKDDGLVLRLDKEHSVILRDEAEFDHHIRTTDESSQPSADFLTSLTDSGCKINLDNVLRHDKLVALLQNFEDIFKPYPHHDGIDCPPMEIPFHNPEAIAKFPPRRLNPEKQKVAEGIFNDLVDSGFAYFNNKSKFGSPIVLVVYPDDRKPRLTGDFSGANGVNALTKSVEPNLPRVSDILEFLADANFIATLDLPKAFWQLNIAPSDQDKTTLVIPGMAISFRRACFGLKNVPAVFQNIMTEIFDIPGVFIYIDDVIIASKTFDDYFDKIRTVCERAKSKRVTIGLNKCNFSTCNHPIKILGHVFLNKTRSIDNSRIKAIVDLPAPKNIKEVRSFVGSVNYLRDWLPQISEELAPIINLTKGNPRSISWNSDLEKNFSTIKQMIIEHIPLNLPSKDSKILISTDASDLAVGGVIWQETPPCAPAGTPLKDRKVVPLSFYSRILQESQKNWSTIQKELYAILLILTESPLSSFLLTTHLTIFTDHKNIAFLYSAPEKNRIVKRWIPILADYNFEIIHTVGSDNHWADMLSRILPDQKVTPEPVPHHVPHITNRPIPPRLTPIWVKCISECIPSKIPLFDSMLSKLRAEQKKALSINDPLLATATWNDKFQLFLDNDNKIIVPESLRPTILLNIHGLVQSGHPSLKDSISRLKTSNFAWPSMINDMTRHVKCCPACQKTAPVPKPKVPHSGTLWSDRPFSSIHVDTIGPLPKDIQGFSFVLVFIDAFTRYTILVPLEKLNAQETAYALVWNVCAIFGIPLAIHSDNGPEFANAVFRDLCDRLAIEVSHSIPHFSQSNGLVERRHRDILQNLRRLLVDFNDYDNWSSYIPVVQLLTNSAQNTPTGHTPYELMFGSAFSPRSDPSHIIKAIESVESNNSFLKDYNLKLDRIHQKREEARAIQSAKIPHLSAKLVPNFRPGDLILRASKSSKKLHGGFSGPFLVVNTPSKSTLTLQNLITGSQSNASVHTCKPYHSDLPSNSDIHKAVASGDSEEHLVTRIISSRDSPSGPLCTVEWFGGDTTEVPLESIKNTAAYSAFVSKHKPPRNKSPPRKRTRLRKGEK
ncbi:hypothetical protein RCL1_006600 [Eukaryota sp. TZLM3-RCL]